jgi:hypothetical protein
MDGRYHHFQGVGGKGSSEEEAERRRRRRGGGGGGGSREDFLPSPQSIERSSTRQDTIMPTLVLCGRELGMLLHLQQADVRAPRIIRNQTY